MIPAMIDTTPRNARSRGRSRKIAMLSTNAKNVMPPPRIDESATAGPPDRARNHSAQPKTYPVIYVNNAVRTPAFVQFVL